MRALVQRVTRASVRVGEELVGDIGRGLLILVGVGLNDTAADADWLAQKVVNLRIFEDANGKFEQSVQDIHGETLVVSQFTLYGDATKGRRPSFSDAARPEVADALYTRVADRIAESGVPVSRGRFAARMMVELVNEGPVTLMIDSDRRRGGNQSCG
jgi:D-aminoacyl-tRNA deacylase